MKNEERTSGASNPMKVLRFIDMLMKKFLARSNQKKMPMNLGDRNSWHVRSFIMRHSGSRNRVGFFSGSSAAIVAKLFSIVATVS